jgi:UDP-N-acetylmuramoylalanine--D-glutamate ligase
MNNTFRESLRMKTDDRVLVVGLGKTGFSVVEFLDNKNIPFAVADTREAPPYLDRFRASYPEHKAYLGGFDYSNFKGCSYLVVSPGVSIKHPVILQAQAEGAIILGDLDLFAAEAEAPVIAITGSNGKSTVTTLVGLMAEEAAIKVKVGGNLGTPMLELLDESAELYVLELSSFQLDTCGDHFRPQAAAVLNISPDHMDRYSDVHEYADSKSTIYKHAATCVVNNDDVLVSGMVQRSSDVVGFSTIKPSAEYSIGLIDGEEWLYVRHEPLMKCEEVGIRGRHNLANALAACALAHTVGIPKGAMVSVLRRFEGLDHRAQVVSESNGVLWINDSKATNVGACIAALNGMDRPVILIAGGDGKGADFELLRDAVREKVKAAVYIGRDAELMERALGDLVPTKKTNRLEEAVKLASSIASSGDIVLLAPACASLDQFKDYQERGRVFAENVRAL